MIGGEIPTWGIVAAVATVAIAVIGFVGLTLWALAGRMSFVRFSKDTVEVQFQPRNVSQKTT